MNTDLETRALKKKRNKKISRVIGLILCILCVVTAAIFSYFLIKIAIFPKRYIIIGIVVLALICIYNIFSQFTSVNVIGKILAVLLTALMIIASLYINKTMDILGTISGNKTEVVTYSVIVKSEDSASIIDDLSNYTFAYFAGINDAEVDTIIEDVKTDIKTDIVAVAFTDLSEFLEIIDSKNVALIINESYRTTIENQKEDFNSLTKVIKSYSISKDAAVSTSNKEVSSEPFNIYISGNDQEGSIGTIGNSDVNIIISVNPETRQILLVTTPRDSYVPIPNAAGEIANDKLTHAGVYGVNTSIEVLEKLYTMDIDYYIKTNFTGVVGIIDALGGITINSTVEFTTTPDTYPVPIKFNVGANECDGEKALAFCRERHAFAKGDFQRGLNQLSAISGIFDKATSPAILINYMNVLDAVTDFLVTDMPQNSITSFVQCVLNDTSDWNIQMFSADLNSGSTYAYSRGAFSDQSFVVLDTKTIAVISDMIMKISNGEVFDVDDYVKAQTGTATPAPSPTLASAY